MACGRVTSLYLTPEDERLFRALRGQLNGRAAALGLPEMNNSRVFGAALQAACLVYIPREFHERLGLPSIAAMQTMEELARQMQEATAR